MAENSCAKSASSRQGGTSLVEDADIIREFLVESGENLDRLDRELVTLEQSSGNREILDSIFRTIHTIKGTCGFLDFKNLEKVAHAGENLLSCLRDGEITLTPETTSALLEMVDAIRRMLANIEATGGEGNRDDGELIERLSRLQSKSEAAESKASRAPETPAAETEDELVEPPPRLGDLLVQQGIARPSEIASALAQQEKGDTRQLGEILIDKNIVQPQEILEVLQAQQAAKATGVADTTIRVDVRVLDSLMNLAGELVLARNQILQRLDKLEECGLLPAAQRLDLVTGELQEGVMKTRMQPIGNLWSKFPRTARDVALSCGKQVRIEMEGKETELDKTILEAIKDPLTHLLRNAVDHGIELPDVRRAAGKNPEGSLLLHAFHEGGQVNIEISDDGGGLNVEKIRQKAIQNGVVTAEQAARLSEREIYGLIFLPGFSTAEKVTNVSGRGVGMDVVRTNVEKIGGTVDVHSRAGAGTTVRLKIPLTLAIVPALIVTCAGDRYAIPQVSLLELVHVEPEDAQAAIEDVHGAAVYRLRGNLLPLVFLAKELQVESPRGSVASDLGADSSTDADGGLSIVVLHADGEQFGLVVDDVNDTREIVVKPLGNNFRGVAAYSGATIMGDGRVALILDVVGLAQKSGVLASTHERIREEQEKAPPVARGRADTLLLFADPCASRMAIPLARAARLEEVPRSAIENVGGREVMQYRGEIMPLIRIGDVIHERRKTPRDVSTIGSANKDLLQVVVFMFDGRNLGLVVGKLLDIVAEDFGALSPASREGVQGCAVIQSKITELIDLEYVARHGLEDVSGANQPMNALSEI